jgi:site-specific DNA-methyltransferase (adenine-specific)
VWRKTNVPENFSMAMAELAWTNIEGNAKVIECASQNKDRFHPTQKPVFGYKKLLQWYSKPGDRILDTHLGSGSSAIAAAESLLDFTGCEIDGEYYELAKERIRKHGMQKHLFNTEGKNENRTDRR